MEQTAISVFSLGLLLGLRHAFDADHVVAVSTIVAEERNPFTASLIGALWGIGHTTTLFIVGLLVLLFHLQIPEILGNAMEAVVGVILVFLGFTTLLKYFKKRIHIHLHTHETQIETHYHFHPHSHGRSHRHAHVFSYHIKPLLMGFVHGLAGSGALLFLVLSTISTFMSGLIFILIFGIGSILGMVIVSTAVGLPYLFTAKRFHLITNAVGYIAACASIFVGFSLIREFFSM